MSVQKINTKVQKCLRVSSHGQRGAALVTTILVSLLLGTACIAMLSAVSASSKNNTDALTEAKAYYAGESGLQAAINFFRNDPSVADDNKYSFAAANTDLSTKLPYTTVNGIPQVVVDSETDEEVPEENRVKGYRTEGGDYVQVYHVRGHALAGSVEDLFHETGLERFVLPLRRNADVADLLSAERLERAIGVLYLPHSERRSHYFHARLSEQFDFVVFIDRTTAVQPLDRGGKWQSDEVGDTFPTGL